MINGPSACGVAMVVVDMMMMVARISLISMLRLLATCGATAGWAHQHADNIN